MRLFQILDICQLRWVGFDFGEDYRISKKSNQANEMLNIIGNWYCFLDMETFSRMRGR